MTDLQDAILDRLVGAKVGVNWPDGPLTIAAEVVGGTKPIVFGLTDNDRGPKAEIARRIGYPVLLIEAIQGGNRGLVAEDDRRAFAMAVFRKVSVGGTPPRLSSLQQNRIAGRMAVRAHAYVCSATCPVPKALTKLLEADGVTAEMCGHLRDVSCKVGKGVLKGDVILMSNGDTLLRMRQSVSQVVNAFETERSRHGWASIRESVRLAASERGLEEAVDCCVEVARQCGVPVVE